MSYHSSASWPFGFGSQTTDQPSGRVQGQVRLAICFSKVISETKQQHIKAEYTNTQQDLSVIMLFLLCVAKGYKQPHIPRETDDSNRFSTLQGKPNSHAWSTVESHPSNRWPFFPSRGEGHSPRLQGTTSPLQPWCSATINKNVLSLRESERYLHDPVRLVTRLTATIFTACG